MTSTISVFQAAKTKKIADEPPYVPDSTTVIEKTKSGPLFIAGQDVLLKQKDGRYYLGTVVQVDKVKERCLVKFGDNTETWSSFRDLTKLSAPEEDLLCVVCKTSSPKEEKVVVVCDKCGRGYHRKCHRPEVSENEDDETWICKRCVDSNPYRLRESNPAQARRDSLRSVSSNNETCSVSSIKAFPYELDSLSWDTYHRVNEEQIYCYCGGNGEWYRQMLQCGRCRQWFHETCIDILQYPLYCGDRFYVYVCSVCNYGKEFLRRLEMKWVDLVHMMLFNLTVYHTKKYYDLDSVIIPYINDNWHALQLPVQLQINKQQRRENILSVLTNNRNRFKCGREIRKKTTIWGLRVRLPPPAPCVTLPPSGVVTENELREMWHGNRRLQIISTVNTTDLTRKIVQNDCHMRNIMMGLSYQKVGSLSDSDSPVPKSPETVIDKDLGVLDLYKGNYVGAGCVKKSAPHPKLSLQRRKRLISMTSRDRGLVRRPKRKDVKTAHRTRLSIDNKNGSLPLTPPTSVSAPPTPPASSGLSLMSDLSNDFSETKQNTPDTSDDETSSKSTLDLIIPPLKDFEGKNNPFLALMGTETNKKRKYLKGITLPLPLTAVIPGKPTIRPKKRQLSEKDIFIGPNGEVKRKKLRRNRNFQPTASKTAIIVPKKPPAKDWDYSRRKLRQRKEKSVEKEEKIDNPQTPKPSPVKQEPVDFDDLKSSVNIYFGAANRISGGERFTVVAKRFGANGKIDFLIEWDGSSNGLT